MALEGSAAVEDTARGIPRPGLLALCTQEPRMGRGAGPSCIGLLHSAWHGASHGAGCQLLFVGWGKCITAVLGSPVRRDGHHLHRGTQVVAAAVAAAAAAPCLWPRMQDSCQSMWGTWLKGLPASSCRLCRRQRTVVNPAPCLQACLSFI